MTLELTHLARRRWTVLVPVVMVMYLLAYLDRSNVALILPYIEGLDLSPTDKGGVSGVFFLGYLVLQVPAVVMARRWGARRVVSYLIVGWAISATACGLVQSADQLYLARFFLGVFEGGVLPVVILLLTRWFVASERSRANTLVLTCLPLSSVLASPFTGSLLTVMDWRAVFVIEGLIPLVWIVPWLLLVRERPTQAWWLDKTEAAQIENAIATEEIEKPTLVRSPHREVLRNRLVWQLVVVYFLWFAGAYGVVLWLPSVVKAAVQDATALHVGALSAIPYLAALMGMLVWSRVAHLVPLRTAVAAPIAVAGLAIAGGQFPHSPPLQLALLSVAATGGYLALGTFYAVPSRLFPEAFAGVAVAVMITFGSIGGFVGPFLVGWVTDQTGSASVGFSVLALCFLVASAIAALTVPGGGAASSGSKRSSSTAARADI